MKAVLHSVPYKVNKVSRFFHFFAKVEKLCFIALLSKSESVGKMQQQRENAALQFNTEDALKNNHIV